MASAFPMLPKDTVSVYTRFVNTTDAKQHAARYSQKCSHSTPRKNTLPSPTMSAWASPSRQNTP